MIDTLIYIADDKHLYSKEGYQAVTPRTNGKNLPILMLVSDDVRLADPEALLKQLPRGAFVLLRSKSEKKLKSLAGKIIPSAHKLGLGVLIAGPVRLAHALGADGAHINEALIKRRAIHNIWPGAGRHNGALRKGFILSASAHGRAGLMRAKDAGVDFVLLGHAFASQSHPDTPALGVIRFCLLASQSPVPVVAIGGLNKTNARARRLTLRRLGGGGNNVVGMAGIGMFGGQK